MSRKAKFIPLSILILSLVLSACIGLIPLEEEAATGDFGPQTSLQEQQTETCPGNASVVMLHAGQRNSTGAPPADAKG